MRLLPCIALRIVENSHPFFSVAEAVLVGVWSLRDGGRCQQSSATE